MKRSELQELLRHITQAVVKEYISMSSTQSHDTSDVTGDNDPDAKPIDAMSPAEKAKKRREKEREDRKAHIDSIKAHTRELDSIKDQSNYFKQQVKQNTFDIKAKQAQLQAEKGAQI